MIVQTDAQAGRSKLTWLRELGHTALDLLFPPRCVNCRKFGAWLCENCLHSIQRIRPPVCVRCGLPSDSLPADPAAASGTGGRTCGRCHAHPPLVDALRACAFHVDPLKKAIHEFKYADLTALAAPLGALMADCWTDLAPPGQAAEVIVPVPLHPRRQRERGYNQAALLARELGLRLHLTVAEDVMERVRATAPQVGLRAEQRTANVQGAFRCAGRRLAGARVLIVDDVFTTGATLQAAADALRQGGAARVWGYALARAIR